MSNTNGKGLNSLLQCGGGKREKEMASPIRARTLEAIFFHDAILSSASLSALIPGTGLQRRIEDLDKEVQRQGTDICLLVAHPLRDTSSANGMGRITRSAFKGLIEGTDKTKHGYEISSVIERRCSSQKFQSVRVMNVDGSNNRRWTESLDWALGTRADPLQTTSRDASSAKSTFRDGNIVSGISPILAIIRRLPAVSDVPIDVTYLNYIRRLRYALDASWTMEVSCVYRIEFQDAERQLVELEKMGDPFDLSVKTTPPESYRVLFRYTALTPGIYHRLATPLSYILRTCNPPAVIGGAHLEDSIAHLWEIISPLIAEAVPEKFEKLAKGVAARDVAINQFLSPVVTGTYSTMAEMYATIEKKPIFISRKIDGVRVALVVDLSSATGPTAESAKGGEMCEVTYQLFIAAERVEKRVTAPLPTGKTIVMGRYVMEGEGYPNIPSANFEKLYLFGILSGEGRNLLANSEEERWKVLHGESVTFIREALRSAIEIDLNEPTYVDSKPGFKKACGMMFDKEKGGVSEDGIIVNGAGVSFYGDRGNQACYKFKPYDLNTIDLLLRPISASESFPNAVATYIGYALTPTWALGLIPRREIKTMQVKVVNGGRKDEVLIPFITPLTPTGYVAVLPKGHPLAEVDLGESVVECKIIPQWVDSHLQNVTLEPLRIREDRTLSYRNGRARFANTYGTCVQVLEAVLDPITPERIEALDDNAPYFAQASKEVHQLYNTLSLCTAIGKALVYGKYLSPVLQPQREDSKKDKRSIATNRTLLEIAGGRGVDYARGYCAGARYIFSIEPDLNASFIAIASANRVGLMLSGHSQSHSGRSQSEGPTNAQIIFPDKCKARIPVDWTLRQVIGSLGETPIEPLIEHLYSDPMFSRLGVSAISIQLAIHYILSSADALSKFREFCLRVLAPRGRIGITCLDGERIAELLSLPEGKLPQPWRSVREGSKVGIELFHGSGPHAGTRKYYIEKAEPSESTGGSTSETIYGKRIKVWLPIIFNEAREEPLVNVSAFVSHMSGPFRTIADIRFFDEPDYLPFAQSTLGSAAKSIESLLPEEDYAYLSLYRIVVFEKK